MSSDETRDASLDDRLPLHGIRIVALADGIAGGYASKLLTDAGADVLAIEPPGGDPLRRRGLSPGSFDADGDGLLFRYLRAGQRARVLDLETAAGAAALLACYAGCDAVLDGRPVGWLAARGLGPEALARSAPRACWLSLSSFGGAPGWRDRAANDFTLQAFCGSTAARGRPGLPPLACGDDVFKWMAATYAALGIAAALRAARRHGVGARADLSKLEAITPTLTNAGSVWGHFSKVWSIPANEDVPSIEPTADGWIGFCIFTAQQWKDFALLVERPDWSEDASLAHMFARIARAAEIRAGVRDFTRKHTTDELLERTEWFRVPAAPIGHGAILPKLDHLAERGVFLRNPRGGFLQPRVPYVSSTWPRPLPRPAPTLAEAGAAADAPAPSGAPIAPAPAGGLRARPLDGVRVLDLTAFWAGPYATFFLGGLGADVIHVESVQRPDGMRFGTHEKPGSPGWWEHGPTYHSANTGKRGLTLDLTRPRGVELLLELVKRADVVVENFSPRVMDNFGIDWAKLSAANPRLVYVRMPAFGLDGPWRNRVGFAQTMEQVSGIAWLTAYPASTGEQAGPLTPRACADPLAGLHAAWAVLLGLARRDATGAGCEIESAMVETLLAITAEGVAEHDATGRLPTGDGNRSSYAAPQGLYPGAASDAADAAEWLALSVETDAQWRALAGAIGRADLAADPAFATLAGRRRAHDALDEAISAWSRTRPPAAAVEALAALGIPCAPVTPYRLGTRLPPIAGSDFVQTVEHPLAGPVPIPSQPLRFEDMGDRRFARAAPLLGQHNRELLQGLLGLDEAALAQLASDAIIGERPVGA